jgi:hypothetical protein
MLLKQRLRENIMKKIEKFFDFIKFKYQIKVLNLELG